MFKTIPVFTIVIALLIEMYFYYHYTECDVFSLSFVDERDAIQKKTFTKWVNKHLKKVRKRLNSFIPQSVIYETGDIS